MSNENFPKNIGRRGLLGAAAASAIVPCTIGMGGPRRANAQGLFQQDILQAMSADGRFLTWLSIIDYSGLNRYATGRIPYTMFAPTNAALGRYPYIINNLLGTGLGGNRDEGGIPDLSKLDRIVRSHAFRGVHEPSEFMGKKSTVTSFAGTPISIDGTAGNELTVVMQVSSMTDTARAETQVVTAPNVVVYPIDSLNLESY